MERSTVVKMDEYRSEMASVEAADKKRIRLAILAALLIGAMLVAAASYAQAGGLKQSVVVTDPNSVPANEASVDTGGRTSANAYGTDGTAPRPLLTDGNGRLYVNINNNNAAAAPTNPYFN